MPVSADALRRGMACFATGVTVVTLLDDEGTPRGITVNSLTSVSLEPPLVLVCVDRTANLFNCFRRNRVFAVNILSEFQEESSRRFASKIDNKFGKVPYRPGKLGSPLLEGCIGYLECRIVDEYPGGDHTIFLAEVEATESPPQGNPLLFFAGKYARL
ncbi:MAG: flavin reductase family protein [Nitrospinota bacterium]